MARLFTFLVVDCPGQPQAVILWDTLEVTVGRGPDRDIVISDGEISRQHALFRIEGQSYTVADLHTSNGTYVNGMRVSRHQLRPGDTVELGPARISFRQETESPKGKNVKFASQLKGFGNFGEGEDAGNRTVMGMQTGPGLVMQQGDYSDRIPEGEAVFDLGGPGAESTPTAAVVDLDPVLDAGLEEVELASFEDEELTALDKDEPVRALPPRRAAPAAAPAPARRQAAPAAPAARPAAPRPQPAPAPVAEPPPPPPLPPQRQVARAPAAAPGPVQTSGGDTSARATLSLELEGPRAVLKSVLTALLDKDIEIPPLKLRVRRPD
jgi:predicted component of type VI protein secretion system